MQRPQYIQNEQLQGQKQHFLEAQSLVSRDKPKNKEAHIDWQIYSLLKGELSCVELYPFSNQPIKGNNCGLIPNAHQFGTEDAINWVQDFYRGRRPCSSIERKYFGQLHVEVPFKVSLKSH